MVKHLPTMLETHVRSLCGEDPLEKEMGPHSSTLAWKIPWTEEPGWLQSMESQELDTTEQLHTHTHTGVYAYLFMCAIDKDLIYFDKQSVECLAYNYNYS